MKKSFILFSLLFALSARAQTVSPLPSGRIQFSNASGLLVGGQVYTCVGGSSCPGTPQATFTDFTGSVQNANPVILDALGSASIWLTPNISYKIVVQDSLGITQWTSDGINVNAPSSSGGGGVVFKAINGTPYCDQSSGADAGAKLVSCWAASSPSGIWDATGLIGAQSAASTVFLGAHGGLLKFGTITLSVSGSTAPLTGIKAGFSGITIQGVPGQTVIKYTGPASTSSGAPIAAGVDASGNPLTTSISNVNIRGVTADANSLAANAVSMYSCQTCTIDGITAMNSHGNPIVQVNGSSGTAVSSDVTVKNSTLHTADTAASFGDGIEFSGVVHPIASHNVIYDVTRIGIVTEQNGAVKSSDAEILNNRIYNAHGKSGGQSNAGLWEENTNGYLADGNIIGDGINPMGDECVTIGGGSTIAKALKVLHTTCSDAIFGFITPSAQISPILVDDFTVIPGSITSYSAGASILGGTEVKIRNLHCGTETYITLGGCVQINLLGNMGLLEIDDSTIGTMTQAGSSADISFYNLNGFTISDLRIAGLRGAQTWRWANNTGGTGTMATNLTVFDSNLNLTPLVSNIFVDQAISYDSNGALITSSTKPLKIGLGVAANGGGFKHQRFGATCSTTNVALNGCTTTYSWPTAFADINYTPVCWGELPSGAPILTLTSAQVAGSITVTVQTAGAVISNFGAVYCIAPHD